MKSTKPVSEVGKLIIERMAILEMNQTEFAELVGVHQTLIGRLVKPGSITELKRETIDKLHKKGGISLELLLLSSFPELSINLSPEVFRIAKQIEGLPDEKKKMVEVFINGLTLYRAQGEL